MRVLVGTVHHPFIRGGAEAHAAGLLKALRDHGHEVDLITMPFSFFPEEQLLRAQEIWQHENVFNPNNYESDLYIPLKYPAWGASHPNTVSWVLHQHRAVYELWNADTSSESDKVRRSVTAFDTDHLKTSRRIFANSITVADRLRRFNGLHADPLYHPPPREAEYRCESALPYIFAPSRIEPLKRQKLLVEAMQFVREPVVALVSGSGGQKAELEALVDRLNLRARVHFCGRLSEQGMITHYARALGVFFAPFDEDYGYITLEAMLSSKPVITAKDSGGPVEFVRDGDTGFVVDADPHAIAQAIDRLAAHREAAARMGRDGKSHYHEVGISWSRVIDALTPPN